jgi:PAS domain S-box-containing protein
MAALGAAGALAIVYVLAAWFGFALRSRPADVAVFWPASGIAVGALLISHPRVRPALVSGVIVGTVLAGELMSDRSLLTSLLKGFCNAGETVLATWLLERWFGWPFTFRDMRRVIGFLAATGLATAISGIGGAATLVLLHSAVPFWDVWREGLLSHASGVVVVAPLMIGLAQLWRTLPSRGELIEGIGLLASLTLIAIYVESCPAGSWLSFSPGIAVLPLLLWLAARCPPTFPIVGAFVVSITVIGATIYGIGRFGDAAVPILERVRGALATATTTTIFTLVLTALFTQRKDVEEKLRGSEGLLAKKSAALARLHEVSSRLWLRHDLHQALDEILAGAIELLGANMGAIRILDATQGVLKIGAHRGFGQEFLDFFREVSAADNSACGRVLRSGERMVIADVEADTLYAPFHSIARAVGYRAVQSTPIVSRQGALLGTLATHFYSVHDPAQQDLDLLDLYVRQAADIIEHHNAEDALRESEERLRLTQLRTGIGIWDWNLGTGKLTWTPEQETIFGVEPRTVKCYADFLSRVHPDDIEKVEAARDRAVQRRETFKLEFRIVRPSGRVRWVSSVGGAFYDEATNEPVRVLGNIADITDRKELEDHKNALISELDHRVKNVLATVLTVASRTRETSRSMAEFITALDGRIKSMAGTHELLSYRRWQGIPIAELVHRELAPYSTASNTRVDGPDVVVSAEAGQTLAMVLHELATNAAKFGAISVRSGRVSVCWSFGRNGHAETCLCLQWQESGGPPVVPPTRLGFGTSVVRELVPYELGGTVDLAYRHDGIHCKLEIPTHWLSNAPNRPSPKVVPRSTN